MQHRFQSTVFRWCRLGVASSSTITDFFRSEVETTQYITDKSNIPVDKVLDLTPYNPVNFRFILMEASPGQPLGVPYSHIPHEKRNRRSKSVHPASRPTWATQPVPPTDPSERFERRYHTFIKNQSHIFNISTINEEGSCLVVCHYPAGLFIRGNKDETHWSGAGDLASFRSTWLHMWLRWQCMLWW